MNFSNTHNTNPLYAFSAYRFHFNGKETDNEVYGEGNVYDYGFRIYNPRLGKFLSVDPLTSSYPFYTPYQFSGNSPIENIDLDGLEPLKNGLVTKAMREGKTTLNLPQPGQVWRPIAPKKVPQLPPTNKVEIPAPTPAPTPAPAPAPAPTPAPEAPLSSVALNLRASGSYSNFSGSFGPSVEGSSTSAGSSFSAEGSGNSSSSTGVLLTLDLGFKFSSTPLESSFKPTVKSVQSLSLNILGNGVFFKRETNLLTDKEETTYRFGIQLGVAATSPYSFKMSTSAGVKGTSVVDLTKVKAKDLRIPSDY